MRHNIRYCIKTKQKLSKSPNLYFIFFPVINYTICIAIIFINYIFNFSSSRKGQIRFHKYTVILYYDFRSEFR